MAEKAVSECEVGCDIAGELNSIMNSSQISSASSTDGQSKASIGIVHNVPGVSITENIIDLLYNTVFFFDPRNRTQMEFLSHASLEILFN